MTHTKTSQLVKNMQRGLILTPWLAMGKECKEMVDGVVDGVVGGG